MHPKSAIACLYVTACTVLSGLGGAVAAAELSITVQGNDGRPFGGVVVVAESQAATPKPAAGAKASMDQRELQFVPSLLVIRTGTAVDFPNSDRVRHQVYSFSGAKVFQLSLYAGRAHPPVTFDKAGVVTLGCNIHDGMIGHIYVTDSPWFGLTDRAGGLRLQNLPAGVYTVRVWHPRFNDPAETLAQRVTVVDGAPTSVSFKLKQKPKPALHSHGTEQQWEDY